MVAELSILPTNYVTVKKLYIRINVYHISIKKNNKDVEGWVAPPSPHQ